MQADHTAQNANDVHEAASYWQETVTPSTLSDDLTWVVDVAIIGGGIMGAAISYWLARAGIPCVLLERSKLAREEFNHGTSLRGFEGQWAFPG